jgi:hypothetical protein
VGALVTTNPPPGSPPLDLPWIITIGPFGGDEDWEPLVCGPYERQHALALAKAVVEDDDLMAVVEPVQPYFAVDRIKRDVAEARAAAVRTALDDAFEGGLDDPFGGGLDDGFEAADRAEAVESPPSAREVREGLVRVAQHLTTIDLG